jgi:hypothetical protein
MKWLDYRTILTDDYRTVVSRVGFQAGALAHVIHDGADESLCGIPRSALSPYEDLDEPVCPKCIEWHIGLEAVRRGSRPKP